MVVMLAKKPRSTRLLTDEHIMSLRLAFVGPNPVAITDTRLETCQSSGNVQCQRCSTGKLPTCKFPYRSGAAFRKHGEPGYANPDSKNNRDDGRLQYHDKIRDSAENPVPDMISAFLRRIAKVFRRSAPVQRIGDVSDSYREAAEKGDATAQYHLGGLYYRGQSVPKDYFKAAHWIRKSAEQGDPHARYNLGFLYERGHGVRQDYAEAANWYRKAAEQADAPAQFRLGEFYSNGHGVPEDCVEAYRWFSLAIENGNKEGARYRDILETKMTSAEIEKAQRLSRK